MNEWMNERFIWRWRGLEWKLSSTYARRDVFLLHGERVKHAFPRICLASISSLVFKAKQRNGRSKLLYIFNDIFGESWFEKSDTQKYYIQNNITSCFILTQSCKITFVWSLHQGLCLGEKTMRNSLQCVNPSAIKSITQNKFSLRLAVKSGPWHTN